MDENWFFKLIYIYKKIIYFFKYNKKIYFFSNLFKTKNTRWQINSINFSNLFAYGHDNLINFKNLPGITGIFGKNRKGKSSIIGALMYGLFNTTDRGSIKNLHIMNSRKNRFINFIIIVTKKAFILSLFYY